MDTNKPKQATAPSTTGGSACCTPTAQSSCCAPSEKASCCGSSSSTNCGCK